MTENTRDGDSLDERLEQLLEEARREVTALDADAEPSDALRDVADEVHDLIATSETATLLQAVGADLPDGAEPQTIPEAIDRSDSESVHELRVLLLLSRLSERGDGAADDAVDQLRERFGELSSAADASGEANGEEARTEADSEEGSGPDADDGAESDEADGAMETFEEQLQAKLTAAVDDFREGIDAAHEERDERTTTADPDDPSDERNPNGGDGDEGTSRGVGPDRSTATLSTLPPSNRADMNQPIRLSTLRPKTGRRRDRDDDA